MNRAAAIAWLGIAIPIAALFGPALVTDRSFTIRDAAHFYYPLFEWCCRQWAEGSVPVWNPYENCGLPVLADTTSSLFYPGKLIFLLPLDFALRYKLYVVLHLVLAAAGTYWLARQWKASELAAALAAIAYACGGNVVFQYCNVVFLVGASWLPLAALAADRMLRHKSWPSAIGLGSVLAMMILGGDPETAFHGLLITGMYAVLLAARKVENDEAAAAPPLALPARQPWIHPLLYRLGLTGLAAVVGFLLAAVQVLPSAEATKYSERAAFNRPRNIYEAARVALAPRDAEQPYGETRLRSIAHGLLGQPEDGSHHDLVYDFSVGPWRLAEYVWPNVSGRMFPTNRRWLSLLPAEGRTWTPTLYLGLLPLILACGCLRLWSGGCREQWLSWLALVFTLATFGYYGLGWLVTEIYASVLRQDAKNVALAPPVGGVYWLLVTLLPTYVYFRYPAKLLPIVSLALSQLAGFGFDRALAERRPRLAHMLWVLGLFSGAVAFLVWCIGPAIFASVTRSDSSLGPFDREGAYHDLLFAFLQTAAVALAGRWLLMKAWTEPARRVSCQFAALLLTAADIAVANAWLVSTAPADLWRSPSPVAAAIQTAQRADGNSSAVPPRVFRGNLASWRPPSFRQTMSAQRPAELTKWEHDTLFPKFELASRISLVESYGSIKLMDYESLLFVARQHGPQQADKSLLPQPTALRLLGTQFLILPEKHRPEFAEPIEQEQADWPPSASLWRIERPLPRAWIVHDVVPLAPLPRPLRIAVVDERTKAVLFPNNKPRDFRRTAVVETEEPLAEWRDAKQQEPSSNELCRITHYDPQRVVVETELSQAGLLVLGDAWFPGWKAIVNSDRESQERTIYRTNRVLRGVWLTAGKQTVEFRFQPTSFVRGAFISAVSWTMLAIVGAIWLVRRRKRHDGTRNVPAT